MQPIFINGRELSKNQPPYIIAEISANHNGSIERAKSTILAAKNAGVSAAKIQTYTPNTMTIETDNEDFWIRKGLWKGRSLYDLYSESQTPFEWHKELFDYARSIDITLFSSPFDETAVDLLDTLDAPAYKIASFEIVDLPLIEYIAKKKKPIMISTGMASIKEIAESLEVARTNGCDELALFHCISSYPTPIDQANLNSIITLRDQFKVQVGLSDHTLGTTASVVATALGATLIEKHFTVSRIEGGVDSSFSLEPDEMAGLVIECESAFVSLGRNVSSRPKAEDGNKIFRRSLYFVRDLKKGDEIKTEDIRRIRPGFGLSPKYLQDVLGRRVTQNVQRGQRVSWKVVERA